MRIAATAVSDSRYNLLKIAEGLFAIQGFELTSIRQIALSAGTNIALISYYFGSKQALYEEIFKNRIAEMNDQLQLTAVCCGTPDHRLNAYLEMWLTGYRLNIDFQRIMFREMVSQSQPGVQEMVFGYLNQHISLLQSIISEGKGRFKHVNPSFFMLTMMSIMSLVIRDRPLVPAVYEREGQLPVEQCHTEAIKYYLYQILES